MRKKRITERAQLGLVLIGILLVLAVILVFAVYALRSADLIKFRISSIGSMFAFIGLILFGFAALSSIGTVLDSLRRHLLQNRIKIAGIVVQEVILISMFGLFVHMVDRWINGVQIESVQTEILLTLFLYGLVTLLGKIGDQIKKQDDESEASEGA